MKVRRFFIRYCDQLMRIQFWLGIVAAVLVGGGAGVLLGAHESHKVGDKRVADANQAADKRVAEVQAINLNLIQTLQQKVTPLAQQQAQVAEQQSAVSEKLEQTTDRVEVAATKSTQAATTASRAASQAGHADRKFREPVGSLRMVPSAQYKPRCVGKDIYGDPCP